VTLRHLVMDSHLIGPLTSLPLVAENERLACLYMAITAAPDSDAFGRSVLPRRFLLGEVRGQLEEYFEGDTSPSFRTSPGGLFG